MCMIPFCEQNSMGQDLCYFHRKQSDKLIPIEDRKYYFGPNTSQDYALCNRTKNGSAILFHKYEKISVFLSRKAALQNSYLDYDDLKQIALLKLWELCYLEQEMNISRVHAYFKRAIWSELIAYSQKIKDRIDYSCVDDVEDECLFDMDTEEEYYCMCRDHWVQQSIEKIRGGLTRRERYILNHSILTEKVLSTRKIARIFHTSQSKIARERLKIIQLLKGECYGKID